MMFRRELRPVRAATPCCLCDWKTNASPRRNGVASEDGGEAVRLLRQQRVAALERVRRDLAGGGRRVREA